MPEEVVSRTGRERGASTEDCFSSCRWRRRGGELQRSEEEESDERDERAGGDRDDNEDELE